MKKVLPILNAVLLLIMVAVSYLSNTGLFNGETMASISARYPTLVTPAGYAFSIWGLIYLGLLGFVIFTMRSLSGRPDAVEASQQAGPWFVLSCLANICWVLAWMYRYTGLSVLIMVLLLVCLCKIILRTKMELTDPLLPTIAFVWWPFSLYVGWIMVALVANVAYFLRSVGWDGAGLSQSVWAIIVILIAGGLQLVMTWKRNMREMAFAGAWALIAIGIADRSRADTVATVAFVMAAVLGVSSMAHGYNNRAYSPFRRRAR